jgi:diguanylate cyclase (GGDEF)-like protein
MPYLVGSPSRAPHVHKVERRADNVITLNLPREADRQSVLDWAIAAVSEAEQRMAALQARVEYLEGVSVTDDLTGLFNRRGFLQQLSRAIASARRGGGGGVLMICDLDGFKAINDRHGHLVGDEVLGQVADLLARNIRRADVAARLGGDEFAILLVGAQLAAARRKAQALRRLVVGGNLASDPEIKLGISFGLAAYSGVESEDQLLDKADKAMYVQKRRHSPTARCRRLGAS